jgi:bacterioferritin (cytochrome b1)
MNAISRGGQDRKQSLLEKDLVHKSDYNQAVADLKDTIKEQQQGITQITFEAQAKISALEERIDSLREQLKLIQSYITKNQGLSEWRNIAKFVQHEKR